MPPMLLGLLGFFKSPKGIITALIVSACVASGVGVYFHLKAMSGKLTELQVEKAQLENQVASYKVALENKERVVEEIENRLEEIETLKDELNDVRTTAKQESDRLRALLSQSNTMSDVDSKQLLNNLLDKQIECLERASGGLPCTEEPSP